MKKILLLFSFLYSVVLYSQNRIDTKDSGYANTFLNLSTNHRDTVHISVSINLDKLNVPQQSNTKKDNITITMSVVAIVLSIIGFFKGISEYKKTQTWKKAEFISKEVKDFNSDFNVVRAIKMLDWNKIPIEITESENYTFSDYFSDTKKRHFNFDDLLFSKALRHHNELSEYEEYTGEETIIRLIIDDFFSKLGVFNLYIKSGLMTIDEIKPYFEYLIQLLCDDSLGRKSKEILDKIAVYMKKYDAKEAIEFCNRFGYLK